MKPLLLAWAALSWLLCYAGPASAGINVEGGLTHDFSLQAGELREGVVVLSNSDDEIVEVNLKQTDYLFTADGRNSFAQPGTVPRSNAGWITFNRERVSVLPRESISIPYTIQVPDDAQLQGTYWSILMVEPVVPPPEVEQGAEGKVKMALGEVVRYGVQFVTHIGAEGSYRLQFVDKRLQKNEDGSITFLLDMENTGERWLRPEVWAEIFDADGNFVGRFSSARKRIFPGTSVRHEFDFSKLPPGQYKALIVADNQDEHVFGAQYTLDL